MTKLLILRLTGLAIAAFWIGYVALFAGGCFLIWTLLEKL